MLKYEEREIIPFTEKIITDNYIKISTDSTYHVNRNNIKLVSLNEFLENIKLLKRTAKENNTKIIGSNKLIKFAKENYSQYEKEVLEYQRLFKEEGELWRNHNLRMGYSDDVFHKNILTNISCKLQKMTYRDKTLFKFISKMNNVEKAIENAKMENVKKLWI